MFVQVYADPFIGERIMNIKKREVRRNVHCIPIHNNYVTELGLRRTTAAKQPHLHVPNESLLNELENENVVNIHTYIISPAKKCCR